MCSAQSAKTLTILVYLAWIIAEDPGPILWLTKNEDEAKKIAIDRLLPIISGVPSIRDKIPTQKTHNKTLEIHFPGAPLVIASAENKAALQSTPYRYLLLDEARSYKPWVLPMVRKRVRSYPHSHKIVIFSTPEQDGDQHHLSYLKGHQAIYFVKCPKCSHEQRLEWNEQDQDMPGGMKWDTTPETKPDQDNFDYDALGKTIRWECENPSCRHGVRDTALERKWLSNSGRWIAQHPSASVEHRSYHWNALLPWWTSWKDQVIEYLEARKALRMGDYEPLKGWWTETTGRPWNDELRNLGSDHDLEARVVRYDPRELWDAEKRRFMTIDVQGKGGRHFMYVVRAWGEGAASRLLTAGRAWTIEEVHAIAQEWSVSPDNMIIDSGHFTSEVYRYCVDSGYRMKAFKGEDKPSFLRKIGDKILKSIWQKSSADPAIGTPRQGRVKPLDLYLYSKPACLDRLHLLMDGVFGEWSLPEQDLIPPDYIKQVTAYERRSVKDRKGSNRTEFFQVRKDDHYASCEIMGICAAAVMGFIYEPEIKVRSEVEE